MIYLLSVPSCFSSCSVSATTLLILLANLKIAAELEGEEFNESEFRDYLKNETQDIKEDFKIDI